MAVFGLFGFQAGRASAASSNTNAMTVRFNLTASVQATEITTNATSTNTIYKVNRFRFTNKDMLNLLATEFGITFPDGAQLGVQPFSGFVVLDKAGDIFLNVSSNLTDSSYVFTITNFTERSFLARTGKNLAGDNTILVESGIEPDITIYYADGKGNQFRFGGLLTFKRNVLVVGGSLVAGGTATWKTISYVISGSGGGVIFNPNDKEYDDVVLTGLWLETGVNIHVR
jgi:hypothetical protein